MSEDRALLQQDREEEERRCAIYSDLAQYRATHQRVEDSRDADLKCNQQGASKFTIPEAQLGPSSMQVFMVNISLRLIHFYTRYSLQLSFNNYRF